MEIDWCLFFELVCAGAAGIAAMIACRHVRVARQRQILAEAAQHLAQEHRICAEEAARVALIHQQRAEKAEQKAMAMGDQIHNCETRLLEAERKVEDAALTVRRWREAIEEAFFRTMDSDNGVRSERGERRD